MTDLEKLYCKFAQLVLQANALGILGLPKQGMLGECLDAIIQEVSKEEKKVPVKNEP